MSPHGGRKEIEFLVARRPDRRGRIYHRREIGLDRSKLASRTDHPQYRLGPARQGKKTTNDRSATGLDWKVALMNIREKLFVFIVGVALSAAVFAGPTDGTVDLGQGGGGTHFH